MAAAGPRLRFTSALRIVPPLAPVAAAVVLAFASGGYFVSDWGVVSVIFLALLAVTALTAEVMHGGRWGAVALAGLVGLAAWQGLSSTWALQPSAAIQQMNLTLLYAAAFALALIGVRHVGDLSRLLWAALLGSGLVTALALGSRLLPDWVPGDDQARLSHPISYWNGLGVIVAFGALLALGTAANPRRSQLTRAVSAAPIPMFLLALLLTYSRGAALALLIGFAILMILTPGRLEIAATAILTMLVSTPLLLEANNDPTIAALTGTLPPHEESGRRLIVALLATAVGAAVVSLAATHLLTLLPRHRRRAAGLSFAACVAAAIALGAVAKMPSEGPAKWAERQIESFTTFDVAARDEAETVADRLAVAAGSGRWQNWEVATSEFRAHPVVGSGAGDYVFFWQAERDIDLTVVNAHSLYLEILGESGLIGLMLLFVPIGVTFTAVCLFLAQRPPRKGAREVALATSAAALVVIHAAGDWDWQLPAVMLPAIALAAAALTVARSPGTVVRTTPAVARFAVAGGCLVAIVLVSGPTMSAIVLADATGAAASGRLETALEHAHSATRLSPLDPAPRLLEANLLSDLGRPDDADAAFAASLARSPHSWRTFADWSASLRNRGDVRGAEAAARRAADLNPREPLVPSPQRAS